MALIGAQRRILVFLVAVGFFLIIANRLKLPQTDLRETIKKVPFPGKSKPSHVDVGPYVPADNHPISKLMEEADQKWRQYESERSVSFKETVSKYRRRYGRYPPPGFKEWYQFARDRNVFNIDDFDQIMDDLRPFWAVEPHVIRRLAAHMWEVEGDGIAGIHIREKKVVKQSNASWRSETLVSLIERFVEFLPDMDIALNRLDQPRVVVPWENLQNLLATEMETRQTIPEAAAEFTKGMSDLLNTTVEKDEGPRENAGWYGAPGKQYLEIAKTACPPESHARGKQSQSAAEARYKDRLGGIITNYNLSSDLCTMGPELQDKHGFMFSASSISATERLVPIFGECKVNVNNDILFPANMYWKHDDRYDYSNAYDWDWKDKQENVIWRGVTSGGVQVQDSWRRMHRQRLVMLLNSTEMLEGKVRILTEQPEANGDYENFRDFNPSTFAQQYTDVGFTEIWGCIPNCSFYDDYISLKPQVKLSEQFKSRYLIDVDGHSFSGRWRAFLESKSLGIKATIFREWHDSRLFAWRHFVPMDNRFDDIYSILTYFIGLGTVDQRSAGAPFVARHDTEAQRLAQLGREWANKVLRREDIEVC